MVAGPPNHTSACALARSERSRSYTSCEPMSSRRHEQSARERRAARIVHLEQRRVSRIPLVREVEPALLHPAPPVVRTYLVGKVEHRAGRIERCDPCGLVRDAIVGTGDGERVRREVAADEGIL